MVAVQPSDPVIKLVPYRVFRDAIEGAADKVTEGVTPEDVSAQQNHIYNQHQGSDPDAEAVGKEERADSVIGQKAPDDVGEAQKIAMKILKDEGETSFAPICFARLSHCACGWVSPE